MDFSNSNVLSSAGKLILFYHWTALEMRDGASFTTDDLEDIISDIEEAQKTYRSEYSVNTQDSSIFKYAPLKCGNIGFLRETSDLPEVLKFVINTLCLHMESS